MKNTKLIKQIIIWIIIGIIVSLVAHFILEFLYFNTDFKYTIEQILFKRPVIYILGSSILFFIYTLFSSVFGSSTIGSLLLIVFSLFVGIATTLKSSLRVEPIYPNDLYWLKEIPFLFEMIGIGDTLLFLSIVILTVILFIFIYKNKSKSNARGIPKLNKWLIRALGAFVSISFLFYVSRFNYPNNTVSEVYNKHADWASWNQKENYDKNGFIAGFLYNLDGLPMKKPTNYSKEAVEEIFNKYNKKADEMNQLKNNKSLDANIVFIMNESFSDPYNLEGITSNKDPLINYRKIVNKSISGGVLAPSYGGGTATNEFQVLTGLSMEPFYPHITSPFIQLTSKMEKFPSIVKRLNHLNYNTTAIHPYTPVFYRRRDVYRALGFNHFIHQDNMKHTERASENHTYISDASAYKEIFDVMAATDEKDFIHLVTMQNHGGYSNKYTDTGYDVSGTGNQEEANAYFKDLENSDIALQEFIHKVNEMDEQILVVFWGDHLPGLYQEAALDRNSSLALRETPLLIYSNFEELNQEVGLRNPIYLNNFVFDRLNMKVSPYEALLIELENFLPVFDKGIYIESEKSEIFKSRANLESQTLDVLEDYTLLMYDLTTGNQYANGMNFFE